MVGLPDTSVRESRSASPRDPEFRIEYPPHRITVNLSPAESRKAGAAFDLPIALAFSRRRRRECRHVSDSVLLGELSLDGCDSGDARVLPRAAAGPARRPGRTLLGRQRREAASSPASTSSPSRRSPTPSRLTTRSAFARACLPAFHP